MVITDSGLDEAKRQQLDVFDIITHAGFGTGSGTAKSTNTALTTETFRELIVDSVKTVSTGIYDITIRVPITQGNSTILTELGFFNQSSGGTMCGRLLFDNTFTKTSDDEYVSTLRIKAQPSNN